MKEVLRVDAAWVSDEETVCRLGAEVSTERCSQSAF